LRNNKKLAYLKLQLQARFLTEAIMHLRPGLYFTGLWGDMKQNKRMENFQRFDANTKGAAMICTDLASRGLDFNGLDWVLQMDCPATVDDYIHRFSSNVQIYTFLLKL
jgi:ATP-dependent RNA helicase DDX10/DBP4